MTDSFTFADEVYALLSAAVMPRALRADDLNMDLDVETARWRLGCPLDT